MSQLHLITTCAKRKRLRPLPGMCFGHVRSNGHPDAQFDAWWDQVSQAVRRQSLPARELYQGAHWVGVRQILDTYPAQLHVLSAGLGLLQQDDAVPGYQASFSRGDLDRVPSSPDWWRRLCQRRLPGQAGPRSLAGLMRANPGGHFLIVASPSYVSAIREDLAIGLSYLNSPIQCRIVTSGGTQWPALAPYLVRSRRIMQPWLGGGLTSLNIRLAQHLLAKGGLFISTSHDLSRS